MCTCFTFCWTRYLFKSIWRTGVICTCITFCWTRHLSNTTLIGPVAFGGRELCVLVLHSVGPDIYLTAFGGRELCVLVLHSVGPDTYLILL